MKALATPFLTRRFSMLAMILTLPATFAQAQNQSWDTNFISDDAFVFAGLNVERLLSQEPKDSELRKNFSEMVLEESNIKLDELKQVQFAMSGEPIDNDEDVFQIKFLFSKEQDVDAITEKMFRDRIEDAEFEGKKYKRSTSPRQPSVYFPDKQTMIVANEPTLKKLMKFDSGKGSMVNTIANADGNSDAFVAFEYNDQLDDFVREVADEMRGLPFDVRDIASQAKQGQATFVLDSDVPLSATIEAVDAEGAERLKRAIDAMIGLGKFGIPQARKQVEEVPDFGDEEMRARMKEMSKNGLKALDVAEAALDGTETEVEGNKIVARVRVMGGVTEVARILIQTMGMNREVVSRVEPAVIEEIPDAAE